MCHPWKQIHQEIMQSVHIFPGMQRPLPPIALRGHLNPPPPFFYGVTTLASRHSPKLCCVDNVVHFTILPMRIWMELPFGISTSRTDSDAWLTASFESISPKHEIPKICGPNQPWRYSWMVAFLTFFKHGTKNNKNKIAQKQYLS